MSITKTITRLGAACLVATISYGGMAFAQNNPTGPDDTKGTASNIPGGTGTPGTFNSQTNTATSSGAKGDSAYRSMKKRTHSAHQH